MVEKISPRTGLNSGPLDLGQKEIIYVKTCQHTCTVWLKVCTVQLLIHMQSTY